MAPRQCGIRFKPRFRVRLDTAYFAENWKHCSKIIFKYVNSTVELIFNIFFLNKVIVGPVNSAQCLLHSVIHVHEQCGLLFISLNALFRSHEQYKWRWKKKMQTQNHPYPNHLCLDTAYFAENWKYCSKIIFKCVNSTVKSSFKVFFLIKYLWVLWTMHETHWKSKKNTFFFLHGTHSAHSPKKKKKRRPKCRHCLY